MFKRLCERRTFSCCDAPKEERLAPTSSSCTATASSRWCSITCAWPLWPMITYDDLHNTSCSITCAWTSCWRVCSRAPHWDLQSCICQSLRQQHTANSPCCREVPRSSVMSALAVYFCMPHGLAIFITYQSFIEWKAILRRATAFVT